MYKVSEGNWKAGEAESPHFRRVVTAHMRKKVSCHIRLHYLRHTKHEILTVSASD